MERAPALSRYDTPAYSVVEYSLVFASLFCLPYIWQRMYMAKSAGDLARSIVVTPFIYTLLIASCWIIGTSAFAIYPTEFGTTDVLLGRMFHDHAPYLGAFVLVAAFAAGISSVDSQLLSSASLLTRDLWQGATKDPELEYRVARYSTLGTLVVVYLACLGMESTPVMSLILLGLSLGVCQLPTLFALFFMNRCPEPAAFWSTVAGVAVYSWRELLGKDVLPGVQTISFCAGSALLVFVVLYVVHREPAANPQAELA
jgi:SSS family solute:Na+ symporter